MADEKHLLETLEFRAIAKSAKLPGLDQALTKLNAIDAALKAVQNRISGLSQPVFFKKTTADIKEMIVAAEKLGRFGKGSGGSNRPASLKPADLAKALGFPASALENFLAQGLLGGKSKAQKAMRDQIREVYSVAEKEFRSFTAAGKGLSLFTKHHDPTQGAEGALKALLGGAPAQIVVPAATVEVKARSGKSPKGQAQSGNAVGDEENPLKKFRDSLAQINREMAEVIKGGGDRAGVPTKLKASAQDKAAQQIRALVKGSGLAEGSKATEDALAKAANLEVTAEVLRQKEMTGALKQRGAARAELAKAAERGDKETAAQLQAEVAALNKSIAAQRAEEARVLAARNQLLKAGQQASVARSQAQKKVADHEAKQTAAVMAQQQRVFGEAMTHVKARAAMEDFQNAGGRVVSSSGPAKGAPNKFTLQREEGGFQHTLTADFSGVTASARSATVAMKDARTAQSAWLGDFFKNTAKVAAWSASVGVLYQTLGLVQHSFSSLIETGAQAARLDQVFSKIGGTTQQLTRDVMGLAAANGRSTDEALASAIQWSRLGLNRAQVNEAVKVSLMAANVAEIDSAEATDKLQAILQTYGLRVNNLRTVLSELNDISNKFNVTNADMLEGLSRTAAVAQQAGIPLQELMGLIGATVGATGQTGANVGNSLKSLTVGLSSPDLQQKLRSQFGFESTKDGENLKGMSQLLADLFVRYEKLNATERQSMLFSVGGKTQASRMAAVFNNYVRAQTLAISAQLNLNSAEVENEKITSTMKAQLAGVTAEWERFVTIQGNRGPVTVLTELTKAFKNLLSVANTPIGSGVTTGILALLTAASAKTALTAMTLKGGAEKGFVGRSLGQVAVGAKELNSFTNAAISGFVGRNTTPKRNAGGALNPGGGQVGLFARGIAGVNDFSERKLLAAKTAMGQMQVASAALNLSLGATAKTLALCGVALAEFLVPLLVIGGVIWAFNKGMSAIAGSTDEAEQALAGFNREAEKARSAADAFAQAAKLMSTAQAGLSSTGGVMRPDDQRKLVDQVADVVGVDEPTLALQKEKTAEFRKQAGLLLDQKNVTGVSTLLEGARLRLLQARRRAQQDEFEAIQKQRRADEGQLEDLKSADKKYGYFGKETRQTKREEVEARIEASKGKAVANLMEQEQSVNDAAEQALQRDQKHLSALESQKVALESIAEIYGQIQTASPLEKNLMDLAKNEALMAATKKSMESLDHADKNDLSGQQLKDAQKSQLAQKETAIQQRIMDLKANRPGMNPDIDRAVGEQATLSDVFTPSGRSPEQIRKGILDKKTAEANAELETVRRDSAQIPAAATGMVARDKEREKYRKNLLQYGSAADAAKANVPLAERATQFQLGRERAQVQTSKVNYGADEGDKLLRQRRQIEEEINALEQRQNKTLEEYGRLTQDAASHQQNSLAIRQRAADVEREIHQLAADQNREFTKSFMGAGPAEMLRKLSAFRLAFDNKGQRKPMSQGGFMAMGPEMRGEYAQLNPNFNPGMQDLQRERGRLAGGRKQAGLEDGSFDGTVMSFSKRMAAALDGMGTELVKALPTQAMDAAKAAMESLTSTTGRLAAAMESAIAKIGGGGSSQVMDVATVSQSGGRGGYHGFSEPKATRIPRAGVDFTVPRTGSGQDHRY